MTVTTVLIVDDHPVFRQGLRDVFSIDDQIEVVGEAGESSEALKKTKDLQPDVVLLDINLPGRSGLQIAADLKQKAPAVKIVMLTGYDEPEQVFHSLRAGAEAFCSKDIPPETLLATIREVHAGKYVVQGKVLRSEEVEKWLAKRMDRFGKRPIGEDGSTTTALTPREMEILEMICRGSSNKDIARGLGISYQTVKNHVTAILHKLGVNDRTQAALYAIRHEWFDIEEDL
jgi:DNA-binding NarL/FixJ family response regulator